MYPLFELFGREVGTYGLCAFIGVLVCAVVGFFLTRRKGILIEDLIVNYAYILSGMVLGGHILYGITNIKLIVQLFANIKDYTFLKFIVALFGGCFGGMVFYGGLIGGIIALYLTVRFSAFSNPMMYDVLAVLIPLFHAFGRVGCAMAGCCYGIESDFGYTVHGNPVIPMVNDVNRFPVQLIEAGCNLIIFTVILVLYLKKRFPDRLLIVYFLIYPVVRFILEFFRDDDYRGIVGGLSTSQIISILLFAAAIIFSIVDHKRKGASKGIEAKS